MILQRFQDFMASRSTSDIPLLAFASDTFVPYWSALPGPSVPESAIALIQTAARVAVDQMMHLSPSYWGLDTSVQRRRESWDTLFSALPNMAPSALLFRLRAMVLQISGTPEDKFRFSKLLEAIYDLIYEGKYRKQSGLDDESLALVRRAYELSEMPSDTLDDLRQPWLDSQSPWDLRLKNYTPDEPNALWQALNDSRQGQTLLPQFFGLLWKEAGSEQIYYDLIIKLQKLFEVASQTAATAPFPTLPGHQHFPNMPIPLQLHPYHESEPPETLP